MKILILGGYGVFGGRLASLLADEPGLEIVIAGRSETRAREFCARHPSSASLVPLAADRRDVDTVLGSVAPDLLVDASGPFQEYGESCYEVVRACLRNKVSYLDLADASDFVNGIGQFDQAAKDAGVFVLSGVSSFPVLSAAVLREIAKRFAPGTVMCGIAPSPFAGVGENVLRAVLGYAGSPVQLLREGRPSSGIGLVETRRYTVAPPGRMPLANLRFSLVDVPDLRLLPVEFPTLTDTWAGAGFLPAFLHRSLNMLAFLRWRLRLPGLASLAQICRWAIDTLKHGEDRGGMFIEVTDATDQTKAISWHLIAEGEDGPFVPCMAAKIVVRNVLGGRVPGTGARSGAFAVSLRDYEELFRTRAIHTGWRECPDTGRPIFRALLEERFADLPDSIQALHGGDARADWHGRATIIGASTRRGRMVARLFGFPRQSGETTAHVTITQTDHGERWVRRFGDQRFSSELALGEGRDAWLIRERFGRITVSTALVWEAGKLRFVPRRWRIGPVPLPTFLIPRGNTFESDKDGDFGFDVEIKAPLVGLIVGYKGTLRRAQDGACDTMPHAMGS